MVARLWTCAGLVAASAAVGCQPKSNGGDTKQTPTAAETDSATDTATDGDVDKTDTSVGTGTVALTTGTVAIEVTPISALAEYRTAESQRTASMAAGSLAIATAGLRSKPRVFSLLDPGAEFHPESIASGSPDGLKITVRKIELRPQGKTPDEKPAPKKIFESAEGVTIAIESGHVDLGQLITAVASKDATKPTVEIETGTYDEVIVSYARAAEVKGCVSGDFNVNAAHPGVHHYCTRAGKSSFEGAFQNDDFEVADIGTATPEWMKFDLMYDKNAPDAVSAGFEAIYALEQPLTVTAGETTPLTMAVDMNRLLRFFNQGRTDQGPNPSYPRDRSYFFTTVFGASVAVFVGMPGRIYGYEAVANACKKPEYDANADVCSGDVEAVAFWLTIITNADGKPLSVSLMPDDDNALTITKGGNFGIDPFIEAGANGVNILYGLDEGVLGKLKDFPASLEADAVDDAVDAVSFEAKHEQVEGGYVGRVDVTRRL